MTDTLAPINSLLVPEGIRSPCGRLRLVRLCVVCENGQLVSPHRKTPWTGPVMRARSWSDSRAVLGECGLHGTWDRWGELTPAGVHQAVVRVFGDGRAVVSASAARVERMSMREIVLHPDASDDALAAVRGRYPEVLVRRARLGRVGRRQLVLHSRGEVSASRRCNGLSHGRQELWGSDGHHRVWHYRAGKRHGRCEETWPDGRRIVERYRDDLLHGRWEERRPDGYRCVRRCRSGKRHGRCEETWPDGRRIVANYRNDLLHGRGEGPLQGRRGEVVSEAGVASHEHPS